jgi:hypothetical protein
VAVQEASEGLPTHAVESEESEPAILHSNDSVAARHALSTGEAESVKSAALDPLGRFAHEYRNLFGERPSETLSRPD